MSYKNSSYKDVIQVIKRSASINANVSMEEWQSNQIVASQFSHNLLDKIKPKTVLDHPSVNLGTPADGICTG